MVNDLFHNPADGIFFFLAHYYDYLASAGSCSQRDLTALVLSAQLSLPPFLFAHQDFMTAALITPRTSGL